MAGIAKECQMCKNQFITRSWRSASWETKCHHCFTGYKTTQAVSENLDQQNSKMQTVIKRIERIEHLIDSIPMIIGAELSNAMLDINGITGLDLEGLIKTTINDAKDDLLKHQAKEIKVFKKKLQGQIVTLNNKIIKLMQGAEQ